MSQDDRGCEDAKKRLRVLREGLFVQENAW